MIEQLENRQLMSVTPAAILKPMTLKVEGTSAGDMIFINQNETHVVVTKNGIDTTYASLFVKDIEVNAKAGDDSVYVFGAVTKPTKLIGGLGSDSIHGSLQNDTIYAGNLPGQVQDTARDYVWGVNGNDKIFGNVLGSLEAQGGDGHDEIHGTNGNDVIRGDEGDDKIWCGNGNDWVYAGDGMDKVWGEKGIDHLYGESGKDELYGGDDADELFGGDNADKLRGGKGDDTLVGQAGNDDLDGEQGDDDLFQDEIPA